MARWEVPAMVRRADVRRLIVERPTPTETSAYNINILIHEHLIISLIGRPGSILYPLRHVAQHVEQSQLIG